ncbi:MAG: Prepilin peptidase [Candidatus Adlerbacteria bacterium]|nr:Prepilin peptidase [Candidatus Adlerbacteria bacterium]
MDQISVLLGIGATLLGVVVGSFLNALSFRWGTGRSVMRGRSRCMHCGHTLSALDLVPFFSYLYLRGRCRYCHGRVSIQYPLVEALGGLLALGVYLNNPAPLWFAYWFAVWMVLLFVVIYDTRHLIIPWSCSIVLIVLALGRFIALYYTAAPIPWMAWWAGPILALPLFLISLVSWGRWMGWSDSLLEISLGWMLGLTAGLTAFMLAFWMGAGVAISGLLVTRIWKHRATRLTMNSEIPLAPFLILGAAVVYFFHVDIFTTLPLLFSENL